jgi:ParB-like chromosome segregation protein Spo0J
MVMATTVADLTFEELKAIVEEIVEEKLVNLRRVEDNPFIRRLHGFTKDTRTYEEILASIERNRWTPPPGTPSSLEMIREDRDR